jgi:recombination protein RecA
MSLDHFLGGGLPPGFTEIFGQESVGKTSLLARIVRAAQEMGKQVAMTSTEYFDAPYFANNGVDLSRLLMLRSKSGEVSLEAAYHLLRSSSNIIYVIDSATGLRPPHDVYDNWVRMMDDWMDEVANVMDVGSAVVMANQVRAKKSVSPSKMFAGGTDSVARKIAGMFSTRIELSRTDVAEDSYDMVVNVVANSLKAPSKVFSLPFVKGDGIDVCRDLVRVAAAVGVIEQRGSWYRWSGEVIGQGEIETARYLSGAGWSRESVAEQTLRALARG